MTKSKTYKYRSTKNKSITNKKTLIKSKSKTMNAGKKKNMNYKQKTMKNKKQKGGWGGFVYGMGLGAILYKWFSLRNEAFENKKNND